jgi:hypothetical protein
LKLRIRDNGTDHNGSNDTPFALEPEAIQKNLLLKGVGDVAQLSKKGVSKKATI